MLDPSPCEIQKKVDQQDWSALESMSSLENIIVDKNNILPSDLSEEERLGLSAKLYLPQTRYYGSKRRLTQWMLNEFKKYDFTTAVDVFGGTSTVSLALKHLNKQVTYNDILESNRTIATALLSNAPCVTTHAELNSFFEGVTPETGLVSRTYKDIYYTESENNWLDGALRELSKIEDNLKKSEILYCLMQACLQKRPFNLFHRKNLYIRENNDKNTKFGNWATWERPFPVLMSRALCEIQKTRWTSERAPIILPCTDAIEIPGDYEFVYLDPPYVPLKKQDITYMDRYHFLEGICMPDKWCEKIDLSKRNHPIPSPESMLKWTDKKRFRENLFGLIEKHNKSIVCLSYVHDAFPDIQDIRQFFSSQFKNTVLLEHDMPHALSKKPKKEIIIIGRP